MSKEIPTITVAWLRKELSRYSDDYEISFSGGLTYMRLKTRGDKLVQMEFEENVYPDEKGVWQVAAHE